VEARGEVASWDRRCVIAESAMVTRAAPAMLASLIQPARAGQQREAVLRTAEGRDPAFGCRDQGKIGKGKLRKLASVHLSGAISTCRCFDRRPRRFGVRSKPRPWANALTHDSLPKGRPLVTERRSAANSRSVRASCTHFRQNVCRASSVAPKLVHTGAWLSKPSGWPRPCAA
jgi:hypothetical protein